MGNATERQKKIRPKRTSGFGKKQKTSENKISWVILKLNHLHPPLATLFTWVRLSLWLLSLDLIWALLKLKL